LTFSVKPGVDLSEVHVELVKAWPVIMKVYEKHGYKTTLTSGRDGKHKEGSYHYTVPMRANDFRTWRDDSGIQLRHHEKLSLAHDISVALGVYFEVIVEPTHIHIEYIGP
jgi:hypothetical protein